MGKKVYSDHSRVLRDSAHSLFRLLLPIRPLPNELFDPALRQFGILPFRLE